MGNGMGGYAMGKGMMGGYYAAGGGMGGGGMVGGMGAMAGYQVAPGGGMAGCQGMGTAGYHTPGACMQGAPAAVPAATAAGAPAPDYSQFMMGAGGHNGYRPMCGGMMGGGGYAPY